MLRTFGSSDSGGPTASKRGELSGRVTVGIEGPPDKNQMLALSRELAEASGD